MTVPAVFALYFQKQDIAVFLPPVLPVLLVPAVPLPGVPFLHRQPVLRSCHLFRPQVRR